jgi:hypothetical protein
MRVSNELKKRIFISPWGALHLAAARRREVPEAIESVGSQAGARERDADREQLRALAKPKQEKEAHGEIETEHPGYLGEPRIGKPLIASKSDRRVRPW